jgi:hypothetical protein
MELSIDVVIQGVSGGKVIVSVILSKELYIDLKGF